MKIVAILNIITLLQIILALGLINVWLVRFKKSTKYRGGGAKNMKDEFAVYGLPSWFMYVVGFFKLAIAFVFIGSLFSQSLASLKLSAFYLLTFLMIGAVYMHMKVKDPFIKTFPALMMLFMSLLGILLINTIF